MTQPKVRFGLKNVHYAVLDEENMKWGTPVAIPGAVNLTLDPQGDSTTFYADDGPYFTVGGAKSYTGTLEVAMLPQSFKTDVLGIVADKNGMEVEFDDASFKPFALLFETATDQDPVRFVYYKVTASNPQFEASTKSESTEVQTTSMDITATSVPYSYGGTERTMTRGQLVKDSSNAVVYEKFYDAVLTPAEAAA